MECLEIHTRLRNAMIHVYESLVCYICILKYYQQNKNSRKCPKCGVQINEMPDKLIQFDSQINNLVTMLFPEFEEEDKQMQTKMDEEEKKKNSYSETQSECKTGKNEEIKTLMPPDMVIRLVPENVEGMPSNAIIRVK